MEDNQTEEKMKIIKAEEVIKYLESVVLYLEAVQQDMMANINKINEENNTNG
jgi:hypothetical protein